MPSIRTAPYGFWRSPITSDLIVAQSIGLSEVRLDGDAIWWSEGRPQEGGRSVLMRRAPDGTVAEVTPSEFNVRTRVHEYGGGAWTVADGTVFFSNDRAGPAGAPPDRRLYRQAPGSAPVPVTAPTGEAGEEWRFADGLVDPRRHLWIGIGERHQPGRAHPDNMLVAVPLEGAGAGSVRILAQGHDFYASPRLSPDGGRLAWLVWDHPNMPWVETTLFVADLDADGNPAGAPLALAGGSGEIGVPAGMVAGRAMAGLRRRPFRLVEPVSLRRPWRPGRAGAADGGGVRPAAMGVRPVGLCFLRPRSAAVQLYRGRPGQAGPGRPADRRADADRPALHRYQLGPRR